MIEEIDNIKGTSLQEIQQVMNEYEKFCAIYNEYKGTNINRANEVLNQVLSKNEKSKLDFMILSQDGWYRSMHREGTNTLKLFLYALGFTHSNFSYKEDIQLDIMNGNLRKMPIQDQITIMSACLKQKLITRKTLINYSNCFSENGLVKDNKVTLYRGLKTIDDKKYYYSNNVEAWTTKSYVAKQFAKQDGYIMKRSIDIDDIFCGRKTAFKYNDIKGNKSGYYIRREHEYIVENKDEKIELIENENIFKASDIF